jgi:tRNA(Met) C34 N-acetyltransferase TmcA
VKTIVEEEYAGSTGFILNAQWSFCSLGTVVTTMRMYDVCMREPELAVAENLLNPTEEDPFSFLLEKEISAEEELLLAELNLSQRSAIKQFLCHSKPITIAQGPPGTGKSTIIGPILKILAQRKERTLVCAPSNKAIQILVRRFMQECPDIPT